jgi:hypothetical protein
MAESTLAEEMKRKIPHLVASITELVRFFALMLLAGNLGMVAGDGGASRLFRYVAAPQLLFAVGFFFLWLDFGRYGSYRPLLAVGKVAALVAFVPFFGFIVFSLAEPAMGVGDSRAALLESLFIVLTDLGSLAVLGLCRGAETVVSSRTAVQDSAAAVPAGQGPSASLHPGQGPGDIERIEV